MFEEFEERLEDVIGGFQDMAVDIERDIEDGISSIEDLRDEFTELKEEFELSIPEVPDFVDRYIVWQKEYIDKNGGVMPMTNLALLPFEGTEINMLQKWLSENFETFCLAYATNRYKVDGPPVHLYYVRLPKSDPNNDHLYLRKYSGTGPEGYNDYSHAANTDQIKSDPDFHFTEEEIREINEDLIDFSYRIE